MLAARSLGIPFIYEVRGLWEITRISKDPAYNYTLGMLNQIWFEKYVATNADHVFTLTNPLKEELIKRGVSSSGITLTPNCCNPDEFAPIPMRDPSLAKKYKIPADTTVIGYIGSFVQYEGLELLIQACIILKQKNIRFHLLLIGNENASAPGVKGPITSAIEEMIKDNDLSEFVTMPGRIPHDEVPAHYSLMDIAPFPRKPQPVSEMVSPLKPLEAFAMNQAVVVSSVQALREMVLHNETGLIFEKGDISDLAGKLESLIVNADLRKRLAENGCQWVKKNRTWRQMAHTMMEKISSLVNNSVNE